MYPVKNVAYFVFFIVVIIPLIALIGYSIDV